MTLKAWLSTRLSFNLAQFSWMIWAACLAGPVLAWKWRGTWMSAAVFLLIGQIVLLQTCITPEYRYLCGIQYAVFVIVAVQYSEEISRRLCGSLVCRRVFIGLSLPWLLFQMLYSIKLIPVASGLESAWEYAHGNICLSQDFQNLDAILPHKAVIYIDDWGMPGYYFPRRVYYDLADVPAGSDVYLLTFEERPEKRKDLVYESNQAVSQVHDIPVLKLQRHWVGVYKLNHE